MLAACGQENSADTGPDMEVSDVAWTSFQGMQIPTGSEGPQTKDAVAPTGYDRSPAGAVLSTVSATVRMSVADDTQWPSIGQKLIAPGAARDEWAVARAQVSITSPVKAGQAPKVLAYRVGEHSDNRVSVRIYSRLSDGSISENSTTATWVAGDWRLALPTGNEPAVRAVAQVPADATTFKED